MATFKIEVILSRFMTSEFKPANPGTKCYLRNKKTPKKKYKFNMCTCVFRSLRFHAYLSTCNPLVLRLIQCKWNFLAVLYRTQVSVDELRFVDKRQFTRFMGWLVDIRVENTADVNTLSSSYNLIHFMPDKGWLNVGHVIMFISRNCSSWQQ